MRALALLAVLALPAFAPVAQADWALHYGSVDEGCGPGGLLGERGRDCPDAGHGGYLEHAGCEGELCALRFWHEADAHHARDMTLTLRSFLRVDGVDTLLCESASVGRAVACDPLEGAVISFPLTEGCHIAKLVTVATAAEQQHAGAANARLNLCREGEQVWVGTSTTIHWVGTVQWRCAGQALPIFVGCHMGTGGELGSEACDSASCRIALDGWAATRSSRAGASIVEARLVGDGLIVPVCAAEETGFGAGCLAVVRFQLPLAEGGCTTLALEATIVMTVPPGADQLRVPFEACRAGEGRVGFQMI